MLDILVDAFHTRFATRDVILKHEHNLKIILESITGTHLSTEQLLERLLPGTERQTFHLNSAIHLNTLSSLAERPYRDYVIHSPAVRVKTLRKPTPELPSLSNKKKKKRDKQRTLTPGILESYDPVAALDFNISHFDYIKIATSFENCPTKTGSRGCSIWFTTGAAIVSIRAREQKSAKTTPSAPSHQSSLDQEPRSTKKRSDIRPHLTCAFPRCSCNDLICTNGPKFRACPEVSRSKKPAVAEERLKKRRLFLHACGIQGKLNNASVIPRVCGCHPMIDGIPDPTGLKASAQSKRAAVNREPDWFQYNEPSNPQFAQIKALLEELEQKDQEIQKLQAEKKDLQSEVSKLTNTRQPLRLSLLAGSPKKVWNLIRFSCIEHFDAYLDLLGNTDRSVLRNLQAFRYSEVKETGYRNRAKLKSKYSNAKLDYRDEAFLYFMRKNGATREQLSQDFGVSEKAVTLITIKWAIFEYRRLMAFGSFISYAEYCELCPTEWKLMYPKMERCELWDTTKLYLKGKPSDQVTQKSTNSEYYGGNVLKGGVGTTPSGWRTPGMLFGGALDDTRYLVVSDIYQAQASQALRDKGPPFHNIVDKGFKGEAIALTQYGGQTQEAPSFRRRGVLAFTPFEAIRTTNVAHKRGRNERIVWGPRSFGFVENGVENYEIPYIVDLLWHNIVFQCNFIFLPPSRDHCADWGRPVIVADDDSETSQ
jgi:hypothetical protein